MSTERDALEWRACEPPDEEAALALLCVTPRGMEYFVHRSGQYALRCYPIWCGWAWQMARLDRREGEERRVEPLGRERPYPRRSGEDRRDPEADWVAFVRVYGNGEAER